MPRKGFTWDDNHKEKYYASPSVQYHLEIFTQMAKQPKTDEVKEKMSQAKRNIPKTDEHKQNMSIAQKQRHAVFKSIKEAYPHLTKAEVWLRVKEYLNVSN